MDSPKALFDMGELPNRGVTDDSPRFDGSSKLPFCTDEEQLISKIIKKRKFNEDTPHFIRLDTGKSI